MCLTPKIINSKHIILFHKGEACILNGRQVIQYFIIKNEAIKIQQYGWIILILKVYIRIKITYCRVWKMRIRHAKWKEYHVATTITIYWKKLNELGFGISKWEVSMPNLKNINLLLFYSVRILDTKSLGLRLHIIMRTYTLQLQMRLSIVASFKFFPRYVSLTTTLTF